MPSHLISYSRRTKHSQSCNQHSRLISQTGFHHLLFVLIWDENFVAYDLFHVNKLSFKDSVLCDHICKKGCCRWPKFFMLTFATKKGCCHWRSSTELFGWVAISQEACRYMINIILKVLVKTMKHWWSLLIITKKLIQKIFRPPSSTSPPCWAPCSLTSTPSPYRNSTSPASKTSKNLLIKTCKSPQ